jgi:hypothetical protein
MMATVSVMVWKDAVVASIAVLALHSPGENSCNREKPESAQRVTDQVPVQSKSECVIAVPAPTEYSDFIHLPFEAESHLDT